MTGNRTPADGTYRVASGGTNQVDAVRLRPVPLQLETTPGRAGDATIGTTRAGTEAAEPHGAARRRLGAHLDMRI